MREPATGTAQVNGGALAERPARPARWRLSRTGNSYGTGSASQFLGSETPPRAGRPAGTTQLAASHMSGSQQRGVRLLQIRPAIRSGRGSRVRAGVDRETGPRPAAARARRARDPGRADLRGQEVRLDHRPAGLAGAARLRPRRGRDRGAHPRPARAHRARHVEPDPRPVRARGRGAQPRRPDPDRLLESGGSDGAARRRPAGVVRADGTHLHPGTGRARPRGGHREGRRIGRPSVVDPHKLAYAAHLREAGDTIAEIVAKTDITRSSLYRHLPPRPADTVTAAGTEPETR